MLTMNSADLAPCLHHGRVFPKHTNTRGVPRCLQASTAKRGSAGTESTATHAERESSGDWANATRGIVALAPKRKSLRSRSERYPQARSGPLTEFGCSETAAMARPPRALFQKISHNNTQRSDPINVFLRFYCSWQYHTLVVSHPVQLQALPAHGRSFLPNPSCFRRQATMPLYANKSRTANPFSKSLR